MKYMVGESEALATSLADRGRRFVGFCWYPYIDSTDWCSLCRTPDRRIDPQGIYYLSHRFDRKAYQLSDVYARLVAGEFGAAEIPAYRMEAAVLKGRRVGKYLSHMTGFDWKDGDASAVAASDAEALPMAL